MSKHRVTLCIPYCEQPMITIDSGQCTEARFELLQNLSRLGLVRSKGCQQDNLLLVLGAVELT